MPSQQGGGGRWTGGEGCTSTQGTVQIETGCFGVRHQGGGHGHEEGRMQKCYAKEENVREADSSVTEECAQRGLHGHMESSRK